jgi:hypothetical protein
MLAAPPARAAIELQPGLWQDTETGTENGKPVKPAVTSSCMTPEEAKNPEQAMAAPKESKDQCKSYDVKRTGDTLTFRMDCGTKEFSMAIAASMTFLTSQHYTGTIKSEISFGGQKMTTDKKLDSKWIGECKK